MSANWTHIFSFATLNSLFYVQKIWNALRGTLGKKNFKNIAPKLVQNTFGHFGKPLNAFFELWNFFDFFEIFRRLDPPWNSGKKLFFPKKSPKTRLDTWERFGQFKNFEIFLIFFLNLFYVSTSNFKSGKPNSNFLSPENWPHTFKSRKSEKPCMEHSAKKLGKITSKHVQNTFGHFWRRLWSIWNFENFLIFFEIFRNPTLHGTRGNFFSKKMPKNMFKTSLDIFGNNSGFFAI